MYFVNPPKAKPSIWQLPRPNRNTFCAPPFIHQLPDSRLSQPNSFTFHISAQKNDDRSHKSHDTRAAHKKFDNAQHDFAMLLFPLYLFIFLSLSNSSYTDRMTNGSSRFPALRS
jgi:hypothetical protein